MTSKLFGSKVAKLPHLVHSAKGGVAGEVGDLRRDVLESFEALEAGGGYIHVDEFVDPPAADEDAFLKSFATSDSEQVFVRADGDFNGDGANTEMVPPRNPTVTSSDNAHVTAVEVEFVGRIRNAEGELEERTVTITTTNGGDTTDAATQCLSFIDRITIPAMGGASGSLQIGFGNRMGLSRKMRARAGYTGPLQEVSAGSLVTNGSFATSGKYTAYTPNSAPNGSTDYAVTYIVDPS